jgi:hypothetical protein
MLQEIEEEQEEEEKTRRIREEVQPAYLTHVAQQFLSHFLVVFLIDSFRRRACSFLAKILMPLMSTNASILVDSVGPPSA